MLSVVYFRHDQPRGPHRRDLVQLLGSGVPDFMSSVWEESKVWGVGVGTSTGDFVPGPPSSES